MIANVVLIAPEQIMLLLLLLLLLPVVWMVMVVPMNSESNFASAVHHSDCNTTASAATLSSIFPPATSNLDSLSNHFGYILLSLLSVVLGTVVSFFVPRVFHSQCRRFVPSTYDVSLAVAAHLNNTVMGWEATALYLLVLRQY